MALPGSYVDSNKNPIKVGTRVCHLESNKIEVVRELTYCDDTGWDLIRTDTRVCAPDQVQCMVEE